jgi:hypothetical protein
MEYCRNISAENFYHHLTSVKLGVQTHNFLYSGISEETSAKKNELGSTGGLFLKLKDWTENVTKQ